MKNTSYYTLLLFLLFCINSCVSYEVDFQLSPEWYQIDFQNPIPGQTSYYEKFEGCISGFELTGDTLKLQLVEKEGVLFLQESYTKMSPIREHSWGRKIITYPFYSVENVLHIPEREESQLFWFYENDFIYLDPDSTAHMLQEACVLTLDGEFFNGNEIGWVDNFELGPYHVENKYVVSCVPDLSFSYLLYDQHELSMSHTMSTNGRWGFGLVKADLPHSSNYIDRSRDN